MKKWILSVLIIILTLFLTLYYSGKGRSDGTLLFHGSNNASSTENKLVIPTIFPEKVENSGSGFYRNDKGKFFLEYPKGMVVSTYKEDQDSYSVTFEDKKENKSFQIFFTPYTEKSISKERFLMDVPTGIIKDKTDILIDGAPAVMFFSKNNLMGETREVWFIKNGYLYEVVTYKDLDSWLSQIMATWKFLKN